MRLQAPAVGHVGDEDEPLHAVLDVQRNDAGEGAVGGDGRGRAARDEGEAEEEREREG